MKTARVTFKPESMNLYTTLYNSMKKYAPRLIRLAIMIPLFPLYLIWAREEEKTHNHYQEIN